MKTKVIFSVGIFLFTMLTTTLSVAQNTDFFYDVIETYDIKLGSKTGSSVPDEIWSYLENNRIVRVDYFDVVIVYYPTGWSVTVQRFSPMIPQDMLFLSMGKKRYWITVSPEGVVVSVEKNILKDPDVPSIFTRVPLTAEEKESVIREIRKAFPGIK